ncbi:hypothetical protein CVT25_013547 [Psilocybe cyanescens]|uniref:Uncharacterized protein n=1 Tax=Psilocybe cyanescens TaxID=93625 RepID=A0A409XSY8_PSICY|nr:hypothetical protein CVT25_013547 [Psilocybe cyanescens]
MPSQTQRSANGGLSFFGMVGGVMALLKLKSKYDEYKQTSADDEEGRVALTSAAPFTDNERDGHGVEGGHGSIALLDTEIPSSTARRTKKKTCCMCCGMDCSLLWKAIGIVLGLYTLYYGFRALKWALTDAPTGLEDMPAFSTSLGCADAPYIYKKTEVTQMIPLGIQDDHQFDIRGAGVGTITIVDGDADSTEIKYEMTIRTDKEDLLEDIHFVMPDIAEDGKVTRSRYIIETSRIPAVDTAHCMRFDIKVNIPPTLKKLGVSAHADAHVAFAPGTRAAGVEELFVRLYQPSGNTNGIIRPSTDVVAQKVTYEVYRGWIVGEASVAKHLEISTQRGDGVANVKITPSYPSDPDSLDVATILTITGAGRSDFTVMGRKEFKRQIKSTHSSSRNADMYLKYGEAEFDGKINLQSTSFTVTGASSLKRPLGSGDGGDDDEGKPKWTHFHGSEDGSDELYISSRGWTRLSF